MAFWTGCNPENDDDDDGTCNDEDYCPSDPDKVEPGICGCGTPDTDGDGDGIIDCQDNFPDDPILAGDVNNDGQRDLKDIMLALILASGGEVTEKLELKF